MCLWLRYSWLLNLFYIFFKNIDNVHFLSSSHALRYFFSVFSSFVYSQTVSMNQEVQMFKLQIEKWILVIYRGLLPVGETKCLYLLLLWGDSDISASVGRLIEESVPQPQATSWIVIEGIWFRRYQKGTSVLKPTGQLMPTITLVRISAFDQWVSQTSEYTNGWPHHRVSDWVGLVGPETFHF